ncbi:MAG: Asp23/Gls24 family envelope stress response protein [Chloroflexota bacterium]|nr:Asp23/Gls24 family envelope stress response protein [Chloroflexota bacterium]
MDNYAPQEDVGKTTISTEVLHKIARLTTLSVEGVSRMESVKGSFKTFLGKEEFEGVKVQILDDMVFAEIYVVLISGMNVRDISREIQSRVSRAISEIVGMEVGGINIHIMDIDFSA